MRAIARTVPEETKNLLPPQAAKHCAQGFPVQISDLLIVRPLLFKHGAPDVENGISLELVPDGPIVTLDHDEATLLANMLKEWSHTNSGENNA